MMEMWILNYVWNEIAKDNSGTLEVNLIVSNEFFSSSL